MQITKNKVVVIDYTLTDAQGVVLDSSEGHEPLAYIQGGNNIIKGLEEALEGKTVGDTLSVSVPPEKAYGLRNDALLQLLSRDVFSSEDGEIEPGMQFQASGPGGLNIVTVVEVTPEWVKVDANHPLAGETLQFDVEVLEVRNATSEELAHGHVHGPDGHHHH